VSDVIPANQHVVIVGAGHAGGTAAVLLRQLGHTGPLTLLGEEALPPYQRPPLSKAWLKGEADEEALLLKPLEYYAVHGIAFHANTRVVRLDRDAKELQLQDDSVISYDVLVIATGARAIPLRIAGADLEGVMFLRTAQDAEELKATIGPGKRLLVIGGGYIGLEVAATGRALGAEVIVVERESRLLARVACEALSEFFRTYHEEQGVKFELGYTLTGLEGTYRRVTHALLSDGRALSCEAVVIGVGAHPNEEIGKEAGLECSRGIVVNLEARTSDPNIFAIGDVAHRPMPIYGRMFRMESVPNALEQAKQAACAITGRAAPSPEVPWQWSDQYDVKLQIAGYPFDADLTLVRGQPSSKKFSVFHLKGDLVQAVEAINSPPDFMIGKQLIGNRKPVDKAKLVDSNISLKEIVA
jgi:3-phenylpropionate/trans-cinnamate dioxygenase ferredoxin reductase subunit